MIPSDLVESVEISKTPLANQDGDAIGGSVNVRTRTASDRPAISLFGIGAFTPISTRAAWTSLAERLASALERISVWVFYLAERMTLNPAINRLPADWEQRKQ